MKTSYALFFIAFFLLSCNKNDEQPTACFTYTHSYLSSPIIDMAQDSVIFTNCSENATSYHWDFGDGTTSTEKDPIHIYKNQLPGIVKLTAFNGSNSDVLIDTIWDWVIAYKPNIYIYPEKEMDLCVSLAFPKGGQVIASIPDYNDSWCVNVKPSGLINQEFDFLFYESIQPAIWQKHEGWVIENTQLTTFFRSNMQTYGFNTNEIDDFIEYWIPKLNESDLYTIYPQTGSIINRVVELDFSKEPQNMNRLFYVIEDFEMQQQIQEPKIVPFNKNGFYVNEWGVVI